jgi:hypothetical protein
MYRTNVSNGAARNRRNPPGNRGIRPRVFLLKEDFAMNRLNTIFVALGAATGAAVIAALPLSTAQAQSGHSLVLAEQACLDRGVTPYTGAFNRCVTRTAMAYEGDVCLSYGLSPQSLGYRQCLANQRALGVSTVDYRIVPEPRSVQTYRVRPIPSNPAYFEEYVVPSRVSYRY